MNVRPARPDEADELTELALRAESHWGYDAEAIGGRDRTG
jgi:hypothetical protein